METCPYVMPMHGGYSPSHDEILVCLRRDRHDVHDQDERHLVLRGDGVYILWWHDAEDYYEHKDDEDFVYQEISELEAGKILKSVET